MKNACMHECTALHDNTCIIHDCMIAKMPDWSVAPQLSVLMIHRMCECPAMICGHESASMIHRSCNDSRSCACSKSEKLETAQYSLPWLAIESKDFQWPMHIDRIQHMTQQSFTLSDKCSPCSVRKLGFQASGLATASMITNLPPDTQSKLSPLHQETLSASLQTAYTAFWNPFAIHFPESLGGTCQITNFTPRRFP